MAQVTEVRKKCTPQNIKVAVRVRPLNDNEKKDPKSRSVLNCQNNKDIVIKERKYTFERVFKPDCSQMEVYSFVVAPMICDVLMGYNCTVFAYGQTGTGKTFTMTGGGKSTEQIHWKDDPLAGCIPRTAANIFSELVTMRSTVEYSVRVSYLELYNEEVHDLLCVDEKPAPLSIFNEPKGTVCIPNLTEETVVDQNGIYDLLDRGNRRKQTAATLMNHQSSRSHTVFTITVHTREMAPSGEDVLKTGKINLVDLAGSENAAKSGAKDVRALELANINKSLLTLGRVIQILSEKKKHVPYRDSKLTRILQDSLGGHTKTCIIATVSPCHSSIEETISTLEYASRARDIRNNPTVNEKVTIAQMVKEMTKEIEKLKRDLDAARSKEGFYVDKENWDDLNKQVQSSSAAISEKEQVIIDKTKRLAELEAWKNTKVKDFENIMFDCKQKKKQLDKAKGLLKKQKLDLKQEKFVSRVYENFAWESSQEAKDLLDTTVRLTNENSILQQKLQQQYERNHRNEAALELVHSNMEKLQSEMKSRVAAVENRVGDTLLFVKQKTIDLKPSGDAVIIDSIQENFGRLKDDIETAANHIEHKKEAISHGLTTKVTSTVNKIGAQLLENTTFGWTQWINMIKTNINTEIDADKKQLEETIRAVEMKNERRQQFIQQLDELMKEKLNEISSKFQILSLEASEDIAEMCRTLNDISAEFRTGVDQHMNRLNGVETALKSQTRDIFNMQANLLTEVTSEYEKCVNMVNENVRIHGDCTERLVSESKDNLRVNFQPTTSAGDTPKGNHINPNRAVVNAPLRDVLLKRFLEENDDDQNSSFGLNDSICSAADYTTERITMDEDPPDDSIAS